MVRNGMGGFVIKGGFDNGERRPKRIMVIDEAWKLFDVEKSCEQVATLYKQARQRNIE